jgi:hypothetical protein
MQIGFRTSALIIDLFFILYMKNVKQLNSDVPTRSVTFVVAKLFLKMNYSIVINCNVNFGQINLNSVYYVFNFNLYRERSVGQAYNS